MDKESTDRRSVLRSRRSGIAVALTLLLLLFAFVVPVGAHRAKKAVHVSGDSVPSDCNQGVGAGAIALTGDLDGCLTFMPERYTCHELNGFARYREWGTESFEGSLHWKYGSFTTTYRIEATYLSGSCKEFDVGGFPFEKQLTGGCDHRVTGVSGVFEHTKGLITFFDVIPNPGVSGASNFLYSARLNMKG